MRIFAVSATFVVAGLHGTPSMAASATTVPATVAAKAATAPTVATAAPVVTKAPPAVATKAPVATKTKKSKSTTKKAPAPVRVGNFCKKTLVGTTSVDASGATLSCKADAKGQPRWTK